MNAPQLQVKAKDETGKSKYEERATFTENHVHKVNNDVPPPLLHTTNEKIFYVEKLK